MTGFAKLGETDHDMGRGWQRRNVDLERGHFSYLLRAGRDPTLILIPGSFGDALCLKEIVDRLDPSMQLVIVEVRGHGGGWPPPSGCSIEEFAADAVRVADELGLERFYIGGHSIGGMIGLEVGRVRPQRVAGIISIEGWTSHHVLQDAFAGQNAATMTAEQAARNEVLRGRVLDHWTEAEISEFRLYWTRWDGYRFLCDTDVPVLEIYGDRGGEKPDRQTLRVPERDNITLHWVADASHNLHLEAPAEVARAATEFICRRELSRG